MPIHFEEVSATVAPPETSGSEAQSAPPAPADKACAACVEQTLRLMSERAERLSDN
ncbi:MAG: DUF5908 family protein [Betaproteobacteria bacterium]|nr:DUF5908 family protein [Betaproteobacteria bacterium]